MTGSAQTATAIEQERRAGAAGRAVVVGGGIAGVAAATVLSERGLAVTLIERERFLGGRAGAWSDRLSDGTTFHMERGFHAFFRQYYNLRALLRRIDPELALLRPLADYPILGPGGLTHTFTGLPTRTPFNVIALTARTPTLGLADLLRIDKRRALEMLAFDPAATYERLDRMTAAQYLDSLRFPTNARRLLFDVFAHSFFNPEEDMSAAELLMMFHFYFTGNPRGLVFDVARAPFSTAIWGPFERYLTRHGVAIRTGETAENLKHDGRGRWCVTTDAGAYRAERIVLAVTVPALQALAEGSPDLDDSAWRAAVDGLRVTNPFAVWRLWLDRPTAHGRAPFVGTTGLGAIDNISLYHLFEDESRVWGLANGGSVVELHAYAIDERTDEAALRAELLGALHRVYPETSGARIVEDRFLVARDCPAFAPGSHTHRPGVITPFGGIAIAGDFVKLPIPSALMERAAASGFVAANHLLAGTGARPEPIRAVSERGILARLPLIRSKHARQ